MEFVKNKNIVVLDIETTGIKANTDKIIELYMLKVYNNEVVDEYYSKFNPKFSSSHWIDRKKLDSYMLPSFTKKVVKYLEKN